MKYGKIKTFQKVDTNGKRLTPGATFVANFGYFNIYII